MEDFDNDGLLDLVVTDLGLRPQPMAFYRNKGDGTFEDRTEAAGLTEQLGGLYCVQTDYNNDGHMDIFIPRGAWLPLPDPADACCGTTATARSPTSPQEAGLLRPGQLDLRRLGRLRQRRLARPVRLLRAAAQPAVPQQGRRHVRGGRRQGRACRATARHLQGRRLDRLRQRRLSRPVPQQLERDRPAVPQQPRRHLHRRHPGDGHRRARRRASRAGPGTTTTTAGSTSSPPATTARWRTWSRDCWASRTAANPAGSTATWAARASRT